MEIRLAKELEYDSIVDGEGLRAVIWTQGCSHNCKGCHNPSTHSFNDGFLINIHELENQIANLNGQDGITLSGGDPFFQPEACSKIARFSKGLGLNVWAYTGFTFEELLEIPDYNNHILELLNSIDVLVDGKFEESQKSLNLYYKGSRNQRILDIKESLIQGKPVEIDKYKDKTPQEDTYGRKVALYI